MVKTPLGPAGGGGGGQGHQRGEPEDDAMRDLFVNQERREEFSSSLYFHYYSQLLLFDNQFGFTIFNDIFFNLRSSDNIPI